MYLDINGSAKTQQELLHVWVLFPVYSTSKNKTLQCLAGDHNFSDILVQFIIRPVNKKNRQCNKLLSNKLMDVRQLKQRIHVNKQHHKVCHDWNNMHIYLQANHYMESTIINYFTYYRYRIPFKRSEPVSSHTTFYDNLLFAQLSKVWFPMKSSMMNTERLWLPFNRWALWEDFHLSVQSFTSVLKFTHHGSITDVKL